MSAPPSGRLISFEWNVANTYRFCESFLMELSLLKVGGRNVLGADHLAPEAGGRGVSVCLENEVDRVPVEEL
jgi:hypothetical protein